MLTLLCVYEDTQDERYGALCRDWAEWVMHGSSARATARFST